MKYPDCGRRMITDKYGYPVELEVKILELLGRNEREYSTRQDFNDSVKSLYGSYW